MSPSLLWSPRGDRIRRRCRTPVVPGATHLFEERGTLKHVTALARDWFIDQLSRVAAPANPSAARKVIAEQNPGAPLR